MRVVPFFSVLALASCGTSPSVPPEPPPAELEVTEPVEATEGAEATPEPPVSAAVARQPTPPTDEQARLFGEASNAFGLELWAHLRAQRGNAVFSPASVALALDMTFGGARGETAAELARVLHAPSDPQVLHTAAGNVLSTWNDPSRDAYTLAVANRLFGERTYSFEEPFLALTRTTYGAPLEGLDFRGAPDPARVHINGWVAGQTRDRIRDLLPPDSIDGDTRLVLVNAVYFLAQWAAPFERFETRPQPFWVDGGSEQVFVPTMHRVGSMRYGATDTAQVLELPYRQNEVAMTLVVPRARDGVSALEEGLDAARLSEWVAALRPGRRVAAALPKFRIAPASAVALRPHLEALGMRLAFTRDADFTGIAAPPDPTDRLFVSAVFHKAFVEVDERGTEAAAATAVAMARAGAAPEESPMAFRADRPFLFFIRDLRSGTVLFMGRVTDPR